MTKRRGSSRRFLAGARGRVGDEIWITVYAAVEVCRRYWNYFRVENEHTTNCGKFRATANSLRSPPASSANDEAKATAARRRSRRNDTSEASRPRVRPPAECRPRDFRGCQLGRRRSVRRRTRRRTNRGRPAADAETDALASDLFERQIASTTTRATTNTRDHFGSTMSTRTRTRRRATWRWGPRRRGAVTGGQGQNGAGISRRWSSSGHPAHATRIRVVGEWRRGRGRGGVDAAEKRRVGGDPRIVANGRGGAHVDRSGRAPGENESEKRRRRRPSSSVVYS